MSDSQGEVSSLKHTVKAMMGDIEDLDRARKNQNMCFNHSEKYKAEALEPIVKFRIL